MSPPAVYARLRSQGADFAELSREKAIRRTLFEEQSGLCAYCERRLRDPDRTDHRTKIEHFHPQNAASWTSDCGLCTGAQSTSDAATTWGNLLLVCEGNSREGKNFTCDTAKGNIDVCGRFRNPKHWQSATLTTVDRTGRVDPVAGLPSDAGVVIDSVLNLNDDRLVAARRQIFKAVGSKIAAMKKAQHGLKKADRVKLIAKLEETSRNSEFATTWLSVADQLRR